MIADRSVSGALKPSGTGRRFREASRCAACKDMTIALPIEANAEQNIAHCSVTSLRITSWPRHGRADRLWCFHDVRDNPQHSSDDHLATADEDGFGPKRWQ